ncbi:MAG: hypothetical protein ACOY3I_02190, partial [Verrucomicrobiota bacterium]
SFFRQNEACPCKGKPHFLLPQLPPPHPHNALTFVIELFDIYSMTSILQFPYQPRKQRSEINPMKMRFKDNVIDIRSGTHVWRDPSCEECQRNIVPGERLIVVTIKPSEPKKTKFKKEIRVISKPRLDSTPERGGFDPK